MEILLNDSRKIKFPESEIIEQRKQMFETIDKQRANGK